MNEEKKKKLYKIILIIHAIYTAFLFCGWISNNRIVLETLLILLIITSTLFYLCDGCIIKKIERYLSKSDYTVIDPLLQKIGINISRENRKKITMTLFSISLLITFYKLYF